MNSKYDRTNQIIMRLLVGNSKINWNKNDELRNIITKWEKIGTLIYLDIYNKIIDNNEDDNYIVFLNHHNSKSICENSIENNLCSTQSFYLIENEKKEWYTNIFFTGIEMINPEKDSTVISGFNNNQSVLSNIIFDKNIKNTYNHNYNTGVSPFHGQFSDKIYIEGMKGYIFPELGLNTSDNLELQLDIEQQDINDILYNDYNINKIQPLINGG